MFESLEIIITLLLVSGAFALLILRRARAGALILAAYNLAMALLWLYLGAVAAAGTYLVFGVFVLPVLFYLAQAGTEGSERL